MIGIKNYVLKYKSLPVVLISRLLAFLRKKPDGQGEVFDNFPWVQQNFVHGGREPIPEVLL